MVRKKYPNPSLREERPLLEIKSLVKRSRYSIFLMTVKDKFDPASLINRITAPETNKGTGTFSFLILKDSCQNP
jgi:hypothetical protein